MTFSNHSTDSTEINNKIFVSGKGFQRHKNSETYLERIILGGEGTQTLREGQGSAKALHVYSVLQLQRPVHLN